MTNQQYDQELFEAFDKNAQGNPNKQFNQITAADLGAAAMNSFSVMNAAARVAMAGNQDGQALVIAKPDINLVQSGVENDYGRYTFKIAMPKKGRIVHIAFKDHGSDIRNAVVVFEDLSDESDPTVKLSCFTTTTWVSEHTEMGFRYAFNQDNLRKIRVGNYIEKDTVFAYSPNLTKDGEYRRGLMLNVAFTSDADSSEDSIKITGEALERMAFDKFIQVSVPIPHDHYPLDLYHIGDEYRCYPGVGEKVRDDGILIALRPFGDDRLSPGLFNKNATRNPDPLFDRCYNTPPGGEVVEVVVHHDDQDRSTSPATEGQFQRDHDKRKDHLKNLSDFCTDFKDRVKRQQNVNVEFCERLTGLLQEAHTVLYRNKRAKPTLLGEKVPNQNVRLIFKQRKVGRWWVVFTIRYRVTPGPGDKETDAHGGKGVNCKVCPVEEMPVDTDGVRADIVLATSGTVNRQNPGRKIAQYLGAASDKLRRNMKAMIQKADYNSEANIAFELKQLSPETLKSMVRQDMELMTMVNPKIAGLWEAGVIGQDPIDWLGSRIYSGFVLNLPSDTQDEYDEIIERIENSVFRPPFGNVSWMEKGERVDSVFPIRIGPIQIILLEKIPDWNGVSIPQANQLNVPAQLSRENGTLAPYRKQPGRAIGESEGRNATAHAPMLFREIHDLANSSVSRGAAATTILTAEHPTDIDDLIDRNKIPYGGTTIHQLVNHMLAVFGIELAYKKVDE